MPSPPRLAAGSVFASDYRVDRVLFEGDDRAVYAVEQTSTGRPLALKVLQASAVPDEPSKQRFLEEARVGGRVQSVHVVDVRGVGVDEATGFPWVLTELLEGQNLGQALGKLGEPPLGGWDELLSQSLHGLAAVHAVGVVHGGLNDESIFLAVPITPDEPFRVELLDFGIPRSARMKAPTQASRLPWLAPEQLDGSDPRAQSDVWALGLVAFHVLAGRPYFKAARGKTPDLDALRAEIAAGPTEAATARARALGHTGALPKSFDAWFARCTALDPSKRFPNAHEALEGAADLLAEASAVDASEVEDAPELAAPRKAKPPPLPPMVAALAQNPKPAIFAIVILMVVALGGGFGLGALRGGKKSPADESRAKATMWAQGSLEASTKACDGGDPTACNGLGQMYLYGQKTPRDEVKAAQQFQRGCDKADQPSCANLAAALLAGDTVPKDPARAVDLYRKACDGGDNVSCADLSDIYRNGNGVPKDEAQATVLRDKACKAGMTEVCSKP